MSRRFDLHDFVDDRIGVRFRAAGGHGEELVCNCPFCSGREKLYVNGKRGLWVCYRCGESGGTVKLVAKVDGLAHKDALRFVLEASVRLPSRSLADVEGMLAEDDSEAPEARAPVELPGEFIPIFDGTTWRIPGYLRARGIRGRTAVQYGLGFALAGRYANRLILPAHVGGELAFFQARSMTGSEPKYLAPVVDRSRVLWGYDEALGADELLVVEGPVDVLGAAQAGLPGVGLMGKTCSVAQAALLAATGASRLIVMLDPEASREGAEVARLLGDFAPEVLVAHLPPGMDPGDAPRPVIQAAAARARPPTLRDRLFLR